MRSGTHTQTIAADTPALQEPTAAPGPGLALLSPDVELDLSEMPDGTVLYGKAAVADWWEHRTDVWQELEIKPEWVAEHDGVLVALVQLQGRGRLSGAPVSAQAAWVASMRHGQVQSARLTFDRVSALEAVAA